MDVDHTPAYRAKTVNEIAEEFQVHRITIYRLLKGNLIPGFKVGRVWRFDSEQVRAWLKHPDGGWPKHHHKG